MTYLIDSHQDLAYNALSFGRDYCRSARETRQVEKDTPTPSRIGDSLLGWEDYQRGQVALVIGTMFLVPKRHAEGEWDGQSYISPQQAYPLHSAQIDYYHRLCDENPQKFRLVRNAVDLRAVLKPWDESPAAYPQHTHAVGIVISMEGAEGIRQVEDMEAWWEAGMRLVGPVWAGGRFCGGTREPGSFTREGYQLLEFMAGLGYVLDISHMNEKSALQALERYEGPVIASHANVRALLSEDPHERQLTDVTIRHLIERGGVMGVIPFNRFLKSDWKTTDNRQLVTLQHLAAHIDYICQLAGSAKHVGIGTDFDGGFGYPDVPLEIDTIADMPKLDDILQEKGYNREDVDAIMSQNWRHFLEEALPVS